MLSLLRDVVAAQRLFGGFFFGGEDDFEFFKNYIYLSFVLAAQVFVSAHRIFHLRCGLWDLVPGPRVKPGLPALGALSLSHWTTREAPGGRFKYIQIQMLPSFLSTEKGLEGHCWVSPL